MQAPKTGGQLSRRKFLVGTVAVTLGASIAEAARIALTFLKPPPVKGFGGSFPPGAVAAFPPGSVPPMRPGRCYVVLPDYGLVALYQRCTHLGCLVPWNKDEGMFACPCHAGRYSLTGEVISGPPPRPLDLFKLEVVNEQIVVDTGEIIQRDHYDPAQAVQDQFDAG